MSKLGANLSLREVTLGDSDFFKEQSLYFKVNEKFDFAYMYDPKLPFQNYLDFIRDNKDAKTVRENSVLSTFLLAENQSGELVGRISIRFELNEFLSKVAGHIGYAITSEQRRKGYGTEILRVGLEFIRNNSELEKILITCDEDNFASTKIIESNGGVFESLYTGDEVVVPKKRFWISFT